MSNHNRRLNISHVIDDRGTGGAIVMLFKLLSHIDESRFESRVLSLVDIGPIGRKIQSLGITVDTLGMKGMSFNPMNLVKMSRWLRQGAPDIVQTWMYNSDLAGGLAAQLAGRPPVVWNIRHGKLIPRNYSGAAFWSAKLCSYLSHWVPTRIICNSTAGLEIHARQGYVADKLTVVPNGFDLKLFRPDQAARSSVRAELGLAQDSRIIGLVARFHLDKDHATFFQAAATLLKHDSGVHFLLCGEGITWENEIIAGWIRDANIIDNHFHLLGLREDIPRLNAAFDLATLTSETEGFPNAVGEAMACAVPCVVTDAGDSGFLVGDTGVTVPIGDSQALAKAWQDILGLSPAARSELGLKARKRIEEHFDILEITRKYEEIYRQCAGCSD